MDDDGPVYASAPPERVEVPGGLALVRPRVELAPSAVAAINASLDHLRPWLAWAADPATLEGIEALYRSGDAGWAERRNFLYVLVDPAGRVLGGSGLHPRSSQAPAAGIGAFVPSATALEIGYWVHVDHAGRGIATEVARALTTAAFTVPGITEVRIQHRVDNVRSARIPEKLGFEPIGTATDPAGRVLRQWVRRTPPAPPDR